MFLKVQPVGMSGEYTYIHVGDIAEITPRIASDGGEGAEIRMRGESAWLKVDESPASLLHRMGMKIV